MRGSFLDEGLMYGLTVLRSYGLMVLQAIMLVCAYATVSVCVHEGLVGEICCCSKYMLEGPVRRKVELSTFHYFTPAGDGGVGGCRDALRALHYPSPPPPRRGAWGGPRPFS